MSAMKIKKKTPQQSPLEKRKTDIFTFVLVALVPLIAMFLLGFSVRSADSVNNDNLRAAVDTLNAEVSRLEEQLNTERRHASELLMIISELDSMFHQFNDDIDESASEFRMVQNTFELDDVARESEGVCEDFIQEVGQQSRSRRFERNSAYAEILNMAPRWLRAAANSELKYVNTFAAWKEEGLEGTDDTGIGMEDYYKEQWKEAQSEVKDLKDELRNCERNKGASSGVSEYEYDKCVEDFKECENERKKTGKNIKSYTGEIEELVNDLDSPKWGNVKTYRRDLELLKVELKQKVQFIYRELE
jgi:hypothetical protein